ncbi:MAG: hemerythrin domain-containing protein [Candidatus Binatia bacterium]
MKRDAALVPLSHDHHTALVLARRCKVAAKAGTGDDAWRRVREAFPAHLEPHFVIEERFLLPALEKIGESEMVARVREDHALLRKLASATTASAGTVERFGLALEAHVRFEERQLFEVAQARLPAETLELVAQGCRTIPRVPPACIAEVAMRRGSS